MVISRGSRQRMVDKLETSLRMDIWFSARKPMYDVYYDNLSDLVKESLKLDGDVCLQKQISLQTCEILLSGTTLILGISDLNVNIRLPETHGHSGVAKECDRGCPEAAALMDRVSATIGDLVAMIRKIGESPILHLRVCGKELRNSISFGADLLNAISEKWDKAKVVVTGLAFEGGVLKNLSDYKFRMLEIAVTLFDRYKFIKDVREGKREHTFDVHPTYIQDIQKLVIKSLEREIHWDSLQTMIIDFQCEPQIQANAIGSALYYMSIARQMIPPSKEPDVSTGKALVATKNGLVIWETIRSKFNLTIDSSLIDALSPDEAFLVPSAEPSLLEALRREYYTEPCCIDRLSLSPKKNTKQPKNRKK